ncbi:transcription initiation factor IIB [Archaeoglobus neptunius]|uniref:transcription initiation factor IIB n=1 Tax=Archaeoglobus neptunius TaxID=2798580 RepID=UPI001926B09B|nr:TFIIB-type zinc ribbon-containing protein [Archaeoglobus neptunius]
MMETERERVIEIERNTETETVPDMCPECGGSRLIMDFRRGEKYCQDCGLVVDEMYIDPGPEWSFYESAHIRRVRTGPAISHALHDRGLSTEIGYSNKDGTGKRLDENAKALATRIRNAHKKQKIRGSADRNLVAAMTEIDRLVSSLGLPPSIKERAATIYKKAWTLKLTKGRHCDALAAASVYAAVREAGLPRTLNEVVKLSHAKKRNIGRAYRAIVRELNINANPTDPWDLVRRYSFALELDTKTRDEAERLLGEVIENNLSTGRDPRSLVAAVIYIASHLTKNARTQREIAEKVGVTEVTIRNRYKEIIDKLNMNLLLYSR